jgi:hypothetical protein
MNGAKRVIPLVVLAALCQLHVACSRHEATDPVAVIRATFDAINAGQPDKAASFFADDAEWTSAFRQATGAYTIHEMLRLTTIPMKTRLEIRTINADGSSVNGVIYMVSSTEPTGLYLRLVATVKEGKIQSMSWTTM